MSINVCFLLVVAVAVAAIVLSKRINDGVIVKFGLILISVGFFGAAARVTDERGDILQAVNLIGIGVLVCIIGAMVRCYISHGNSRRFSDYVSHGPIDPAR